MPQDAGPVPSQFIQEDADRLIQFDMATTEDDVVDITYRQLLYAEAAQLGAHKQPPPMLVAKRTPLRRRARVAGGDPGGDDGDFLTKEDYWQRNQHFKHKQFESLQRKKLNKQMRKL